MHLAAESRILEQELSVFTRGDVFVGSCQSYGISEFDGHLVVVDV